MVNIRKRVFIILFFLIAGILVYSKPYWINKGVYLKYSIINIGGKLPPSVVINYNMSWKNNTLSISIFQSFFLLNGTYSIYFIDIKGNYLILKAYVSGFKKGWEGQGGERLINVSAMFRVNIDTREVYTMDGKYLGITPLWIPSTNITSGKTVIPLFAVEGKTAYGIVYLWGGKPAGLPAGVFKDLLTVSSRPPSPHFTCFYDRKTGLLVKSVGFYFDPIISYLLNCSFINSASLILYETNIFSHTEFHTPGLLEYAKIFLLSSLMIFIAYCILTICLKRKIKNVAATESPRLIR
ncbi:MAG: hypothetical protein DRJ47_07240 [Thermoprotei archaeon]|nr:MAG: hypothetical protein DRJ47_07240 [Thermoprotei archaeon]